MVIAHGLAPPALDGHVCRAVETRDDRRRGAVGIHRTARLLGAVAAAVIHVACDGGGARILPSVERSDDLDVATLADLPAALDPEYLWSYRVLREVPTVSGDDAEPLVFEPAQVLPLSSGELLVFDPTADHPLVLVDPESATARARFGRSGQGPGELGPVLTLAEVDDLLLVLDMGNRQLHRFSRSGVHLSSERVVMSGHAGKALLAPGGEGFLVEGFRSSDAEWHRVLERVAIDSGNAAYLLRLPDPSPDAEPGRTQQGRVIWTVLDGAIVAMWSARPEVVVYAPTGQTELKLRLPLSQLHLTEGDIQRQVSLYGPIAARQRPGPTSLTNELYAVNDTIFGMLLSGTRRAAEDPVLPDGEIWWRMFTVRGEYVGVLRPPGDYQDFRVLFSGNGRVWARAFDPRGYPVLQELALVRGDAAVIPSS